MAAAVAASLQNPSATRAQFQMSKIAEQRRRARPSLQDFDNQVNQYKQHAADNRKQFGYPESKATKAPTSLQDFDNQVNQYKQHAADNRKQFGYPGTPDTGNTNNNTQQTQTSQSPTTAGETYQRAFRGRQIQRQIGANVGLDLNRRATVEEDNPIDQIQQDYGSREAELLEQNQLGLDQRATPAKRAAQAAIKQAGLDEGLKAMQDEFQKKMSALITNSSGAAGEFIDSLFEDGGVTQGLVFVQNQVQAARTILSPAPPETTEITSLEDLKSKFSATMMDSVFPRFNLHTAEGIEGILKALFQWLVIGLLFFMIVITIATPILVGIMIQDAVGNPLAALFSLASAYFFE